MALKTFNFEIFSNGFDDVIDITSKVFDYIKNDLESVVVLFSNSENCVIIQKENTGFLEFLNSFFDEKFLEKNEKIENFLKYKNEMKSLICSKNEILNLENLKNNKEKIFFLDFSSSRGIKKVCIKIIN